VDLVPLDLLDRDWQRELASGTVAERLCRWQLNEPALGCFCSVESLTRYLRTSQSGERQDAVLGALVRQAHDDPVAARLVLQRLLPGLKRRAGRAILDAAEREELWSLLLAQTWERIRTYPIERRDRHVAAGLVLDSVRDTLALLAKQRQQAAGLIAEPPEGVEDRRDQSGDVVWLLRESVEAGAISREEAGLILETRIDQTPLDEAAAKRGVSRHALVVRRLRAERRLALQLGWGRVTHRGSVSPLCGARVSGAGLLGPAGGEEKPTPPRR
jgi:hypothetical protein